MKHRAIVLALASASALLPGGAHAAEDFCSRLIIQAINQFCQLLPNGASLCQPVALIGPSAECKVPERQGVVQVPLGPPTLQPLAPWAAPHGYPGLPTHPATATAALSPFVTAPAPPAAPALPTMPAAPAAVMVEAAKPVAEPTAARGTAKSVAQANVPTVAPPAAPVAAVAPSPTVAPPEMPAPPTAAFAATVSPAPETIAPVEAIAPTVIAPITAAALASEVPVAARSATPAVEHAPVAPPEAGATAVTKPETPAPGPVAVVTSAPVVTSAVAAVVPAEAENAADALAHFDFDSATLTDAGRAELDAWLTAAPKDKRIRVSGHADRLGPEPYNLKLSARRAEAVKQYLIGKGMSPRHIELEAKGESDPVKRCKGGPTPTTKDCLAPNRRVIIVPE